MTTLAGFVVNIFALWLVGLAVAAVVARERTERFLRTFASSLRAHLTEQILRLIAGAAFVRFAPEMRFTPIFSIFGWLLVGTAAVLLVLPWRWHHRFGVWAIPLAIRYLRLYALGALVLGAFILYAAL